MVEVFLFSDVIRKKFEDEDIAVRIRGLADSFFLKALLKLWDQRKLQTTAIDAKPLREVVFGKRDSDDAPPYFAKGVYSGQREGLSAS